MFFGGDIEIKHWEALVIARNIDVLDAPEDNNQTTKRHLSNFKQILVCREGNSSGKLWFLKQKQKTEGQHFENSHSG